jgi:cell division protein FtsL
MADEGPPMYIPQELADDITTERQSRYAETPLHTHEEDENASITHKALYLLIVLIVCAYFFLLNEMKQDLLHFKTETFYILESISEQIKPTKWEIVPSS